jgi:hypothetical protein
MVDAVFTVDTDGMGAGASFLNAEFLNNSTDKVSSVPGGSWTSPVLCS